MKSTSSFYKVFTVVIILAFFICFNIDSAYGFLMEGLGNNNPGFITPSNNSTGTPSVSNNNALFYNRGSSSGNGGGGVSVPDHYAGNSPSVSVPQGSQAIYATPWMTSFSENLDNMMQTQASSLDTGFTSPTLDPLSQPAAGIDAIFNNLNRQLAVINAPLLDMPTFQEKWNNAEVGRIRNGIEQQELVRELDSELGLSGDTSDYYKIEVEDMHGGTEFLYLDDTGNIIYEEVKAEQKIGYFLKYDWRDDDNADITGSLIGLSGVTVDQGEEGEPSYEFNTEIIGKVASGEVTFSGDDYTLDLIFENENGREFVDVNGQQYPINQNFSVLEVHNEQSGNQRVLNQVQKWDSASDNRWYKVVSNKMTLQNNGEGWSPIEVKKEFSGDEGSISVHSMDTDNDGKFDRREIDEQFGGQTAHAVEEVVEGSFTEGQIKIKGSRINKQTGEVVTISESDFVNIQRKPGEGGTYVDQITEGGTNVNLVYNAQTARLLGIEQVQGQGAPNVSAAGGRGGGGGGEKPNNQPPEYESWAADRAARSLRMQTKTSMNDWEDEHENFEERTSELEEKGLISIEDKNYLDNVTGHSAKELYLKAMGVRGDLAKEFSEAETDEERKSMLKAMGFSDEKIEEILSLDSEYAKSKFLKEHGFSEDEIDEFMAKSDEEQRAQLKEKGFKEGEIEELMTLSREDSMEFFLQNSDNFDLSAQQQAKFDEIFGEESTAKRKEKSSFLTGLGLTEEQADRLMQMSSKGMEAYLKNEGLTGRQIEDYFDLSNDEDRGKFLESMGIKEEDVNIVLSLNNRGEIEEYLGTVSRDTSLTEERIDDYIEFVNNSATDDVKTAYLEGIGLSDEDINKVLELTGSSEIRDYLTRVSKFTDDQVDELKGLPEDFKKAYIMGLGMNDKQAEVFLDVDEDYEREKYMEGKGLPSWVAEYMTDIHNNSDARDNLKAIFELIRNAAEELGVNKILNEILDEDDDESGRDILQKIAPVLWEAMITGIEDGNGKTLWLSPDSSNDFVKKFLELVLDEAGYSIP